MKLICFILLQLNLFSNEINKLIRDFKSQSGNESINVSVSVRSLESGHEVYAYHSGMNLPPASTLKLITTGTAIAYLGESYKFETMIFSNGKVKDGVIDGDLLIEGVGDPTFGSYRFKDNPFEQIYDALKTSEIATIEGRIKVLNNDETNFPLQWLVGDLGNYYGAFSNNFNFNENRFTVYFNGGDDVGDPTGIANIYPFDDSWKIKNKVLTGKANSGDKVNILNIPFSSEILLVGTVPLNARSFAVKGAVPNINKIFTDSLGNYLKKNRISVSNSLFSENQQMEELGSVLSPDIASIARETNLRSVNIFADGLANFMWEQDSKSYDEFLKEYWMENGLNLNGQIFLDGSGLAPQNAISCLSMTSFLYKMKDKKAFLGSIPVLGREGTVASMGKNTNGRILAKSGTISNTRNYSGYFTANSGKKYAFSIYTNGFNMNREERVKALINSFFTKVLNIKE